MAELQVIPFEKLAYDHFRLSARKVYGRILRTKGELPHTLAAESGRRIAMVMGPAGLALLSGMTAAEMLLEIGYTKEYVARELTRGVSFYLFVFAGNLRPKIATWDNVIAQAGHAYPSLREDFEKALPELKTMTLLQCEQSCGFSLEEVDALGVEDPRFMTEARFVSSSRNTLCVRRFLYHCCRLSDLYAGDGMTTTWDGRRGMREYVVPNVELSTLSNNRLFLLEF